MDSQLTQLDRLCFNCPLPDCDENNPQCLRRRARHGELAQRREHHRRWKQQYRAAQRQTASP